MSLQFAPPSNNIRKKKNRCYCLLFSLGGKVYFCIFLFWTQNIEIRVDFYKSRCNV